MYGLGNSGFVPVPVGQQYAALDSGTADAVDAFTTDPQLVGDDYEVLADPELLFGSQNVVMTVDSASSRCREQKFLAVVDAVNSSLTQDVDRRAERRGHNGRTDTEVARRTCGTRAAGAATARAATERTATKEDGCPRATLPAIPSKE